MGLADLGSRAIIGRIFLALEETAPPPWVTDIGMLLSSDSESETYRWLGSVPAMREWLGGRNANRLDVHEKIITNKPYEATLEVMRSELRRDKTDHIQLRINELAVRAQQHWAKLLSDTIAANGTAYDGVAFFHASHTEGDSGTQSNAISYDGAATPTAADLEGAVLSGLESLLGFKDGAGEPMNQGLSEMTIMAPVGLFSQLSAAVSSGVIVDGSASRTNTLVNLAGYNMKLVANPRLTGSTVFYCFRSDSAIKPFILQEEKAPQVEALAEGSDFAFANDAHQYSISKSCAVGNAVWQHAVKVTLT